MDFNASQLIILVLVGLMAGALSGFVGVGGGIIVVPAMIYFMNMNQMQAQGISLALLMLPVGILGVMNYYKAGHIQFNYVLILALGFVLGNYFGSKYALRLPEYKIKFVFALLILFVGVQMLWKSGAKWLSEING
ncbi:MAG: sulfite exporter TauE/SafE family protein [Flavobacteriales bacterium]